MPLVEAHGVIGLEGSLPPAAMKSPSLQGWLKLWKGGRDVGRRGSSVEVETTTAVA